MNSIFLAKAHAAQNFSYQDRFLPKILNRKRRGWGPSSYQKNFIFLAARSLTRGEALIKIGAHLVSKKNCKVYLQSTGEYMGAQKQNLSRNRR